MESSEYIKMADAERTYWWHVGRNSIVSRQLRRLFRRQLKINILNVGSGTGGTIPIFQNFGNVINVDVSGDAHREAKARGATNLIKVKDFLLPFRDNSFELVAALDVLEHIEDHENALKEWYRVLRPDGALLLTVPAYQWLWSSHDESLHHYRRYTAADLHRLLNLAGYKVEKRTYAISFSFPLVVGYRLMNSLFLSKAPSSSYVMLPHVINKFLIAVLRFEGQILRFINFPFGTSVLAIAKRQL